MGLSSYSCIAASQNEMSLADVKAYVLTSHTNYSLLTILDVIRHGSLPLLHNAVYLFKFLARVIGVSSTIVKTDINAILTTCFDKGTMFQIIHIYFQIIVIPDK